MGDLSFYGKENAENREVTEFYQRSRGSAIAAKDPFAFKVDEEKDERLMALYYNAEYEDGYHRDQSPFGDGISIEDNMGVIVRYANKAIMTYSLNAHSPWEGYQVHFNGTEGRLELNVVETDFVDGNEDFTNFGMRESPDKDSLPPEITFQPHWGKVREIPYESSKGAHEGGDPKLLKDLFRGVEDDIFGHAADCLDGARSILTGIAANISMQTGKLVEIDDLVNFYDK
jgi:Oxidoreductase family, C-terminal alpha/beta domain